MKSLSKKVNVIIIIIVMIITMILMMIIKGPERKGMSALACFLSAAAAALSSLTLFHFEKQLKLFQFKKRLKLFHFYTAKLFSTFRNN